MVRGRNSSLFCQTPNLSSSHAPSEGIRVSCMSETGITETWVKAPKCRLSVNTKGVLGLRQQGGWLRSSHPLTSA